MFMTPPDRSDAEELPGNGQLVSGLCRTPSLSGQGYDYPRVSEEVYINGFEEHIRSRGEEVRDRWRTPARRWVVERTFAWLKGFRSLRTRYCCYLVNFMGLLYLALACILWRKLV